MQPVDTPRMLSSAATEIKTYKIQGSRVGDISSFCSCTAIRKSALNVVAVREESSPATRQRHNMRLSELLWMRHSFEDNETSNPTDIALLGGATKRPQSNSLPHEFNKIESYEKLFTTRFASRMPDR